MSFGTDLKPEGIQNSMPAWLAVSFKKINLSKSFTLCTHCDIVPSLMTGGTTGIKVEQ
jgi:hypothetical protein